MVSSKYGLLMLAALTSSQGAWAHARFKPDNPNSLPPFKSPSPPRNDSTGLKTGPCGNVPRTANPLVHKPGDEITVQWEETIDHPGHYIIRFSPANDLGFEQNVLIEKIVDTQNTPIGDPSQYHQYSATVKLPNVTCTGCTLQLIQHMDDAPDRPYYSCSDIQLVAPTSPATPAPLPTPATPVPETAPAPESAPTSGPVATPTGTAPGSLPSPASGGPLGSSPAPQKPAKPQGLKIEPAK